MPEEPRAYTCACGHAHTKDLWPFEPQPLGAMRASMPKKIRSPFLCRLFLAGACFLLFTSTGAAAVELGGELETALAGAVAGDGKIDTRLQNTFNLQLRLPRQDRVNTRFEVEVRQEKGATGVLVKSMYIRQRFTRVHLTVGRQPVSWSFGALLNPVDFQLGAEALDEETEGKFVDAVELYIPMAWNAGISLVGAFPPPAEEPKWGVRVRAGFHGYDLAASFVLEPARALTPPGVMVGIPLPAEQRLGFTAKGDLGPVGVYGALCFTRQEGGAASRSLLGGVDYSCVLRYIHPLSLQVEYVRLEPPAPWGLLGLPAPAAVSPDEELNLVAGRVSYGIDDFTTIGLLAVTRLDDHSLFWMPAYETYLGGNVALTVSGGVFQGGEGALFAPRETFGGFFALALGYSF